MTDDIGAEGGKKTVSGPEIGKMVKAGDNSIRGKAILQRLPGYFAGRVGSVVKNITFQFIKL